jgi:hypothetical protein
LAPTLPIAALLMLGAVTPRRAQATPLSDETAVPSTTLVDRLVAPLANEAMRRRAARQANDPAWEARIDGQLNEDRVNFLLFGQGETYEPPFTKVGVIGSHTILSYNTRRQLADLVSITHDTRAPEIERYIRKATRDDAVRPIKIDQALDTGMRLGATQMAGLALMRETLENATGLAIDYQLAFWDDAIVDMVNTVFGKVRIDVPKSFKVNAFYLKGKRYPEAQFNAGVQEIDGLQCLQFIKTVAIEQAQALDPELEHNARKHLLFRSMFDTWRSMDNIALKAVFLGKIGLFLTLANRNERIMWDFDSTSLLINNVRSVADGIKGLVFDSGGQPIEPGIGAAVYIVDRRHGDGGVGWVKGNTDPIVQQEFARGLYLDENMEVALGGDPYATDLVAGYWGAVRAVVKRKLTAEQPRA